MPTDHLKTNDCNTLNEPWCYTDANNSNWGNCAPEGANIPTGTVGKVPNNLSSVSTGDRHLINKSGSNYGQIDINWANNTIKLSIQTESEEVSSTVLDF